MLIQNKFFSRKEEQAAQKSFEIENEMSHSYDDCEVISSTKVVELSNFIFEKELASGAYGKVWSAQSTRHSDNERFAIK